MGVMKENRQMPVAVESVGHRKTRVRTILQTENAPPPEGCGPQRSRLSNSSQDAEEVLSEFLKITQCAMVNIVVCPCLHPSLTHHRNINPFENKV